MNRSEFEADLRREGYEIREGEITIGLGIALRFVPRVKPDLKADALPEFVKQQAGDA